MGPSMRPTFKPGDGLTVTSYGRKKIRVGDVVLFRHPQGGYNIVHRVVSVGPKGIRTRGDNNVHMDPWTLQKGDILGQVVSARRKNTNVVVTGGMPGLVTALAIRAMKKINLRLSKLFRPIYHRLERSGLFNACLPLIPRMRLLSFEKPQGRELYLFMGARPIARRSAGGSKWQISRPFRLFINETSLPE